MSKTCLSLFKLRPSLFELGLSVFQFGLPLNSEINIILRAKKKWCSSCKSNPQILFMLDLNYSGNLHHGVFLDFFYKHNRIINRILKFIEI